MVWLTDKSPVIQSNIPNKIETLNNQVYYYDGNAYLVPRGLITDNYTIPLGINKSKWDSRPAHLHDIGCKFHQLILIDIPLYRLTEKYLRYIDGRLICDDIPIENLKVIPITFNKVNNLLRCGMEDCGIPNWVCSIYRLGVNFNINWLFTGREKINLSSIYKDKLIT